MAVIAAKFTIADDVEERFKLAVEHLPTVVSEFSQDQLLYFYARFKQANEGPCDVPKPGFLSLQARRKWQAWKDLGDMSAKQAMMEYVQELDQLCPSFNKTSSKAMHSGGGLGVSVSTLRGNDDEDLTDEQKTAFDWVKEGNMTTLKSLLEVGGDRDLNEQDEDGMTMLHWASDRGHSDIIEILLARGANINAQDNMKQTALHYACSCNHVEAVRLLVSRNADTQLEDEDGLRPADCSSDPEIKRLINR